MEVYRTPEFLIIHLKRFSHTRNSLFGSRKINDLIDFPTEGLEMSSYVLNEEQRQKGVIYDLYAVSNHFGSLNGGHYTAYTKNFLYKKWFNFDDSEVFKCSASEIVTKSAYVLFYRLRK